MIFTKLFFFWDRKINGILRRILYSFSSKDAADTTSAAQNAKDTSGTASAAENAKDAADTTSAAEDAKDAAGTGSAAENAKGAAATASAARVSFGPLHGGPTENSFVCSDGEGLILQGADSTSQRNQAAAGASARSSALPPSKLTIRAVGCLNRIAMNSEAFDLRFFLSLSSFFRTNKDALSHTL